MKIGFLFPGQGTQYLGMGKDIYEEYQEAKEIYDRVKQITNIDIAKISFEGPEEILNETKYTQLAVLTMSLAIVEILRKYDIKPEISAGLSLGEYTALINSKAIPFEEGINLVKKRGEYMQEFVPSGKWQMAAIIGLKDEEVEDVCKQVKNGFVVPANYNCIGQVSISGDEEGILEAEKIANRMGAIKVIILKTSGPFHTNKLEKTSIALKRELSNIELQKFESKVIKNIDGEFYNNKDDIKNILSKHVVSPVRFSKTIQNMLDNKIDTFIEIGPGKTLSGCIKRMKKDKKVEILSINNVSSLLKTIKFIKEEKEDE